MKIRLAHTEDIDVIMDIYALAREFMRANGNKDQWWDGYPPVELIEKDIKDHKCHVCIDPEGDIAGVFYFAVENDVTYAEIYDGKWLTDKPYGVVHRIASSGKIKGVASFCLQWCFEQAENIRIDTHRDNAVMRNVLQKNGYAYCGIIYIANGTERLAFQKSK